MPTRAAKPAGRPWAPAGPNVETCALTLSGWGLGRRPAPYTARCTAAAASSAPRSWAAAAARTPRGDACVGRQATGALNCSSLAQCTRQAANERPRASSSSSMALTFSVPRPGARRLVPGDPCIAGCCRHIEPQPEEPGGGERVSVHAGTLPLRTYVRIAWVGRSCCCCRPLCPLQTRSWGTAGAGAPGAAGRPWERRELLPSCTVSGLLLTAPCVCAPVIDPGTAARPCGVLRAPPPRE